MGHVPTRPYRTALAAALLAIVVAGDALAERPCHRVGHFLMLTAPGNDPIAIDINGIVRIHVTHNESDGRTILDLSNGNIQAVNETVADVLRCIGQER